jgi:hypothetical protein
MDKSVNESLDLEGQVLNMSQHESKKSAMSFEMEILDSQEFLDKGETSGKDLLSNYDSLIGQIIENPKIDKKQLLSLFLGKMQMSGQVGDMQKELDLVQRVLTGKREELDDPYQSEEKRVSIIEDGESLFRDPKSSMGLCEGIDDDYADFINQIADGSRNESQVSVVIEQLDSNDAEVEEKNPKVSSGKKSTS